MIEIQTTARDIATVFVEACALIERIARQRAFFAQATERMVRAIAEASLEVSGWSAFLGGEHRPQGLLLTTGARVVPWDEHATSPGPRFCYAMLADNPLSALDRGTIARMNPAFAQRYLDQEITARRDGRRVLIEIPSIRYDESVSALPLVREDNALLLFDDPLIARTWTALIVGISPIEIAAELLFESEQGEPTERRIETQIAYWAAQARYLYDALWVINRQEQMVPQTLLRIPGDILQILLGGRRPEPASLWATFGALGPEPQTYSEIDQIVLDTASSPDRLPSIELHELDPHGVWRFPVARTEVGWTATCCRNGDGRSWYFPTRGTLQFLVAGVAGAGISGRIDPDPGR